MPNSIANSRQIVIPGERGQDGSGKSHASFRALVEFAPVGVFETDGDGNAVFVNSQWCELTGLPAGQAMGCGWLRAIHPEDRDRVWSEWRAAAQCGRAFSSQYRVRTPDGRVHWIEGAARAIVEGDGRVSGYIGTTTDVTERRGAEAALREQEDESRLLIASVPDFAVFSLDAQGGVRSWNDGARRLLGYEPGEILGRHFSFLDRNSPGAFARARAAQEKSIALGRHEEDGLRYRKDGTSFWANSIIAPLWDEQRRLRGFTKVLRDISARKRMETELRVSEERFERCVRGSSDGLWDIDLITRTVYISPRCKELLGYPVDGFQPEFADWRMRLHPEDRKRALAVYREHLSQTGAFDIEHRLRCRDGAYRWFRARGEAIWNDAGVVVRMAGSLTDITAQRAAQTELSLHARHAALIGEIGVALTRSDELGCVLRRCCDAIVRHLDAALVRIWTLNEPDGMLELQTSAGMYTHIDGCHARIAVGQWKIGWIAKNRSPILTNDFCRDPRASDPRWAAENGIVSFAGCPLLIGDRLVGVLAIFARKPLDELTLQALHSAADAIAVAIDHKRASAQLKDYAERMAGANRELSSRQADMQSMLEELRHVNEALEDANDDAEAANRAKSEFLANMSHEIRTPMTAILGFAENLQDPELSEQDRRDAAQTILRHGRHLLNLINDILDLSRIEAGKLPIENTACSPLETLSEAVGLLRDRAEAKGLTLALECDAALSQPVVTDERRLQQVLINLLGNAIKFTDHGGVRVVARAIADATPKLQVDVIDTGIGMTPDQAGRVFQLFTQADTSMARRFGGTGLGLAICRRLAELLGGDTTLVHSAPGEGSTFRVTIAAPPASLSDGAVHAVPECAPETGCGDAQNLAGARILVAEDGPDNQRLLAHVLRRAGADVTVVDNGGAVLEAVNAANRDGAGYEVILMDMQMPILDGYQAASALRARGYRRPILALTAHAMVVDLEQCIRAGCNEVITKPIERTSFLAALGRYFVRPGEARSLTSPR